ncbi:hypothetical protein TPAR_08497 [Tolypocladium paradoxum]|uniref:Uncharacterized protein n=1 Tax=Tolypocladium paradoxum TaxID=94208 RepID=A0A2S4KM90_9HYPO|nr:hypothetical protein TPAR_08497 [Tolypocladium paradoxum]
MIAPRCLRASSAVSRLLRTQTRRVLGRHERWPPSCDPVLLLLNVVYQSLLLLHADSHLLLLDRTPVARCRRAALERHLAVRDRAVPPRRSCRLVGAPFPLPHGSHRSWLFAD